MRDLPFVRGVATARGGERDSSLRVPGSIGAIDRRAMLVGLAAAVLPVRARAAGVRVDRLSARLTVRLVDAVDVQTDRIVSQRTAAWPTGVTRPARSIAEPAA